MNRNIYYLHTGFYVPKDYHSDMFKFKTTYFFILIIFPNVFASLLGLGNRKFVLLEIPVYFRPRGRKKAFCNWFAPRPLVVNLLCQQVSQWDCRFVFFRLSALTAVIRNF